MTLPYTKAGGACGECQDEIAEILATELKQKPLQELKPRPRLTNDETTLQQT